MTTVSALNHVAVTVRDIDVSGPWYQALLGAEPLLDEHTAAGFRHLVWALDDRPVAEKLTAALKDQRVYIADGHHRYETAMTYRAERRAAEGDPAGEQPYDFAPVYLANRCDPGLEAGQDDQAVGGTGPAVPTQASRQQREAGACGDAEHPMRQLGDRRALVRRELRHQSGGLLTQHRFGWRFRHQTE